MFSTFHQTIICLLQLAIYCCVYWHREISKGNKRVICCAGEHGGAAFCELVAFPGWLMCASFMELTWKPHLRGKNRGKRFLSSLLPVTLANLVKISQQVQILGRDGGTRQGSCVRLIHCLRRSTEVWSPPGWCCLSLIPICPCLVHSNEQQGGTGVGFGNCLGNECSLN